jgi:DNA polymerase III sliding clamp (beta) subunit (PCNA family)
MAENKLSLTLHSKEFAKEISICNQVSPKRAEAEIFTNLFISIKSDTGLTLSATNGSLFYSNSLPLSDLAEGTKIAFLIKTEALSNILSLISDDQIVIDIDLDKQTLVLHGAKSKHQLRISTTSAEDFKIPQEDDENIFARIQVPNIDLGEANKFSLASVGQPKNIFQPQYLNICYIIKPSENQLVLTSTDRFRITKNNLKVEYLFSSNEHKDVSTNFLVPPAITKLLASVAEEKDIVEIVLGSDYVQFLVKGRKLISKLGEGKFEDLDRIIPQSFGCIMLINTKEFVEAIRQVSWVVRSDINRSVNLAIEPTTKKILFSSTTSEGDRSEYEISIETYEGVEDNWNQSFNADYLLDYINLLKSESFLWESNPGKTAVLSAKDLKEKQFYLVSGLK